MRAGGAPTGRGQRPKALGRGRTPELLGDTSGGLLRGDSSDDEKWQVYQTGNA